MTDRALRPAIDVRIHDTHIGIWQGDPNDPSFRAEIYAPLLNALKRRGWAINADPEILKHYRLLSPDRRLAARGNLRAEIGISGRAVEVKFWAETWPLDNPNGRRYDFDKLKRMEYLDRLRVRLEFRRTVEWLETLAPVTVKADAPESMPALERIERRYRESWHSDKNLGRPVCKYAYNGTSKDGQRIEHAATVWYADCKGRIGRGTAYYNINNMWWVTPNQFELVNLSSGEIYTAPPQNLRVKRNERQRRARLEGELAAAVRRMDFRRAETLRNILFGSEQIYLIWHREHSAYYRPDYCGYTTDTISAGKYTREEAEREVRRVSHLLEAIGPDGERIRFEAAA